MADPAIVVKILMDLKTLNTSLDSAAKRINTWSTTNIGGFLEFGKAIAGVTIRLGAMAAPFIGVGLGVFKLAKSTADAEEQLGKMSKRLGISVEEFSKLKTVAYFADISVDELGMRLGQLSRHIVDASNGVGESSTLFKKMGIDVEDSAGNIRNMSEILSNIADKFKGYDDGAAKAALANELFGRGGNELIPMLNSLNESLAKTSSTMTKENVKSAFEFNDNLKKMALNVTNLKQKIGNELIPALNTLFDLFTKGSPSKQRQNWLDDLQRTLHGTGAGGITDIKKMPFNFEGELFFPKTEAPSVGGADSGKWVDRPGNMEKLVDDMAMKIDKQIAAKEDMIRNTIGMKLMRAIGDGMIFSGERTISDVLTNLFTGEKIVPMDIVRSFGKLVGRTLGDSIAAAAMQPLKNFLASLFGAGGSAFTSFFSASGGFTGFSSGAGAGAGVPSLTLGGLYGAGGAMAKGGDPRKSRDVPGGIHLSIGSGYTSREIGDIVSRELQDGYGRNSGIRKVIKAQR